MEHHPVERRSNFLLERKGFLCVNRVLEDFFHDQLIFILLVARFV